MKPVTVALLGVGGLGLFWWMRKKSPEGREVVGASSSLRWRDEDLPATLRALPDDARIEAGNAYFSKDTTRIREVSRDLEDAGYHDAAEQLELRAILVGAAESDRRFAGSGRA